MEIDLTETQIANFERDGVVPLRGVIGFDWLEKLRIGVEKGLAKPGPRAETYKVEGRFLNDFDLWTRIPEFRDWGLHGPYPRIAAHLMRSSQVNFFMDQLFIKEAGTSQPTPWHQDRSYMAVDGEAFITFWTSIYSTPAERCMQFVRGSHRFAGRGFKPFDTLTEGKPYEGDNFDDMPDFDSDPEGHGVVGYGVEPGDCLAFFSTMVHKGLGNPSGQQTRVSITARYVGDDATYAIRTPPAEFPHDPPVDARHGAPLREYPKNFPKVWPRD